MTLKCKVYAMYIIYLMLYCNILGQLYTQLGLVYSSLKMHSDAIQNFERALPLVRVAGTQNGGSLCQEAALLQNIGAVYNETKQFVEAVIYHKTAASLYSKQASLLSLCVYYSLTRSS